MISIEKLLRLEDVAQILGISVRTLYQWRWRGINLPFVKVGSALRVSSKDLESFIKEGRIKPNEEA